MWVEGALISNSNQLRDINRFECSPLLNHRLLSFLDSIADLYKNAKYVLYHY